MSIEHSDSVDFVSIDEETGRVLLTISDHLDWQQDEGAHLLMLQNKLNSYLRFIESGEMDRKLPQARGRRVTINLVAQFPLSKQASTFFQNAKSAIERAGFSLEFKLLGSGLTT
ncbi:MAG: hypothetical protein L6R19_07485 [Alphaproteobacteria bacterium]|nr:hypothetical protein [Alphaproteobacteria bacterium]